MKILKIIYKAVIILLIVFCAGHYLWAEFFEAEESQKFKLKEVKSNVLEEYFNDNNIDTIYASNNLVYFVGKGNAIGDYNDIENNGERPIIFFEDQLEDPETILEMSDNIFIKQLAVDAKNITDNQSWLIRPEDVEEGEVVTSLDLVEGAQLTYKFNIPRSDNYSFYLNLKHDSIRGTLQYSIDQGDWSEGYYPVELRSMAVEKLYRNVEMGSIYLSEGEHSITFRNVEPGQGKGYQHIRYFIFKTEHDHKKSALKINYQEINPIEYKATISNAESPYFLNLTVPFDNNWKMQIDQSELENQLISNGYTNAWYIEKIGDYELTLSKQLRPSLWIYFAIILFVLAVGRLVYYIIW